MLIENYNMEQGINLPEGAWVRSVCAVPAGKTLTGVIDCLAMRPGGSIEPRVDPSRPTMYSGGRRGPVVWRGQGHRGEA